MLAVAELTLRKMREGTLLLLILIGAVFCVLADSTTPPSEQVGVGTLLSYALGSQSKAVPPISAGTACAMLFSVLLGVFWGSSEIPGDISSGLAMVVLSKPVGRVRYALGKYLGMLLAALGVFAVFELALVIGHFAFGSGATSYGPMAIVRQLMPPLMLCPLVAIAMTASLVAGGMGGMVITILYMLFSVAMSFIPVTLSLFPEGTLPGLNTLAASTRFFVPNLIYFFQENIAGPLMVSVLLIYTVCLTTIFLILLIWRICSMDMNR